MLAGVIAMSCVTAAPTATSRPMTSATATRFPSTMRSIRSTPASADVYKRQNLLCSCTLKGCIYWKYRN